MKHILKATILLFCAITVTASSYPRSIFCRVHQKEAYFARQTGFGRTQSCYYTHGEYVPGVGYATHTLVTDCD